ncbi:MAG: hypothetical protein MZV70_63870 [Desulfobacterales bacterium]|nr:hypothetical protein [Desulfobacterales bacterium]
MAHKRSVVHICRESASIMRKFYGEVLPIDMDTLIAGAILLDVGKLIEYAKVDGELVQSRQGSWCAMCSAGWPWPTASTCRLRSSTRAVHSRRETSEPERSKAGLLTTLTSLTFEPLRSRKDRQLHLLAPSAGDVTLFGSRPIRHSFADDSTRCATNEATSHQ